MEGEGKLSGESFPSPSKPPLSFQRLLNGSLAGRAARRPVSEASVSRHGEKGCGERRFSAARGRVAGQGKEPGGLLSSIRLG